MRLYVHMVLTGISLLTRCYNNSEHAPSDPPSFNVPNTAANGPLHIITRNKNLHPGTTCKCGRHAAMSQRGLVLAKRNNSAGLDIGWLEPDARGWPWNPYHILEFEKDRGSARAWGDRGRRWPETGQAGIGMTGKRGLEAFSPKNNRTAAACAI